MRIKALFLALLIAIATVVAPVGIASADCCTPPCGHC